MIGLIKNINQLNLAVLKMYNKKSTIAKFAIRPHSDCNHVLVYILA